MANKSIAGVGAKGILTKYRKDVKKKAAVERKELPLEEVTEELIVKTGQITILKKWAVKLRVPNLASYKLSNINKLKEEMLKYFHQMKDQEHGPKVVAIEEEDQDLERQYDKILDFLKGHLRGKVIAVYGNAGDNFVDMWNQLNKDNQHRFAQEYLELNKGDKKISPILKLKEFLENIKNEENDTTETITRKYLILFLRIHDKTLKVNPDISEQMLLLEQNPLFSNNFISEFRKLDLPTQLKFSSRYIRNPKNPVDALSLFLNPAPPLEKKIPSEIRMIPIAGIPRYFPISKDEEKKLGENQYSKCISAYRSKNLVVKPISIPAQYIGPHYHEGYFYPTNDLFMLICQFRVSLNHQNAIIEIQTGSTYKIELAQISSKEIVPLTPYQLKRMITQIEQNNIFAKIDPIWILNSPLYQVESSFVQFPYQLLLIENPIVKLLSEQVDQLQKESRNETLLVYYTKLITLLFPFFTFEPKREFSVIKRLEKGYISAKMYANIGLVERIPEIPLQDLIYTIENNIPEIALKLIRNVNGDRAVDEIKINLNLFSGIRERCPLFQDYQIEDIVLYFEERKEYCFSLPELLKQFLAGDTINKYTNEPFDQGFIKDFLNKYWHLEASKFVKIHEGKEGKEITEDIYVNKELYDLAHPVQQPMVKKDQYSPQDLAGQFDDFFQLGSLIENPIVLIDQLMSFEIGQICQNCLRTVHQPVFSMANRSDGSIIPISFCDYKCMNKYEFAPLHVAEENLTTLMSVDKLVDAV
jgi:hypothetical protein